MPAGRCGCCAHPDGAYDKTVVDLLATRRLQLILWTVDSRDWARPGVHRILATVARELRPGAIILLHDGGGDRSQTVAALPALLRQLHARGYRAVALPPVQRGRPNGQAGRRPRPVPLRALRVENVVL